MAKRWLGLLGLIAVALVGWLVGTSDLFGRTGRGSEGSAARTERRGRGAPSDAQSGETAKRDGAVDAHSRVVPPPPVDLAAVDRELDLHGIVVRKEDGAPVAGAALQVLTYPWRRAGVLNHDGYFATVEGPRTVSSRDGTFSLRLRRGSEVALHVSAEGYASLELADREAGERVRIEMEPGVRLTVVTRDERGAPASGTKVRIWRTDGEAPTLHGVTDERGRCTLGALPGAAAYTMDVSPAALGYHGWETVVLPEEGEHEHLVTLVEGRTLTGVVTDAATGAAIANARVGMNWVMSPSVLSDASGRNVLPGWLGVGVDDIHCVADGYGRAQWLVAGDSHDFALSKGDSVTGRLLGATGLPVAGATLSSIGSVFRGSDQRICTRASTSDGEGRFLLSGLSREMPHTLIAMAQGHGRYLLDFDPHPNGPGVIDLGDVRLPTARLIAGSVVSSAGAPATRVEVTLSGYNSDRGRLRGAEPVLNSFYGASESRRTDDLGRFRFADLSPGRFELQVRRPGASAENRPLVVTEGADLLDVKVVLPEGREFTVTVVDEEGVPVPTVFVTVEAGAPGFNGQSNAQGRVTFFVPGSVTKITAHPFATGRGLLREEVTVEGDLDEFRLVLRKASTITGTISAEAGQPLGEAWVAATKNGRQVASAQADADGDFTLEVPRGETFVVEFFGVETERRTIERGDYAGSVAGVASGAAGVLLRVRMIEKDRTLRVRVVYPDGTAAAQVPVSADRARTLTDEHGIAVFTGLHAREITLMAHRPQGRDDVVAPRSLTLLPAGQEVTLSLRTALTISGVVILADGTPVAGASVQVREGDRVSYAAPSDREGRFAVPVPSDEPGPWTLRAELRERGLKGEIKEVRTGDAGLRIQIR